MVIHKYKEGDAVIIRGLGVGVITGLQISTIDNKSFPSYWIVYSKKIHSDGRARNTYESNIISKI